MPAASRALQHRTPDDTPLDLSDHPLFSGGNAIETLSEIIRLNMGDSGEGGSLRLSYNNLQFVTIPAGGGTIWSIPDPLTNRDIHTETISGIIVHMQVTRTYWEHEMQPGQKVSPDCSSDDGVHGLRGPEVGNPSGLCDLCPKAVYNTAKHGRGQACRTKKRLYILPTDEELRGVLPLVIVVPPASLQNLGKYMQGLAGKGIAFYSMVTSLSLEKVNDSQAAAPYSRIVYSRAERLTREQTLQMAEYHRSLREFLPKARVSAEAVEPQGPEIPAEGEIVDAEAGAEFAE